MAVALFIANGSKAGQQIPVGAGQIVRVGRTSRSDYAFPEDNYLSGVHFEIRCNEGECAVHDLGSSNGTFVNGARIEQAAVKDGDEISAGEMTFLVQFSSGELQLADPAAVGPAEGDPVVSPGRTERMFAPGFEPKAPAQTLLTGEQKRACDILMYQTAPLFAVLDAARGPSLSQLLSTPALRCQPLFVGEPADGPAGHAPILVELGQASSSSERADVRAFLETLLLSGWGKSWGIFFTSLSSLDDVAAHFRGFLLSDAQDDRPLYLRLYDPRVLRALLPTCEPPEIVAIFGPVVSYLIESERPDILLAISRGSDGLITARVSLSEQPMQAGSGL